MAMSPEKYKKDVIIQLKMDNRNENGNKESQVKWGYFRNLTTTCCRIHNSFSRSYPTLLISYEDNFCNMK